jgi:hypothetical protein
MPRSGTVFFSNLVAKIFDFELIQPRFTGGFRPDPPEWDPYKFDRTFLELQNGQVVVAHYPIDDVMRTFLEQKNVLGIYLYRDPRDVAVSAALYIKYGLRHHFLHEIFSNMSDEDAIAFMLSGGCVCQNIIDEQYGNKYLKPIIYEGMQYFTSIAKDWISDHRVMKIRYEDFTNNPIEIYDKLKNSEISIEREHFNNCIDKWNFIEASNGRTPGVEDKSSHYRKGIPGDHENYFGELHRALAKKFIGHDLISLNYEQSLYW